MHRTLLPFALLSTVAVLSAPSCANTLDGDDDDGDGGSGGGNGTQSCEDFADADGKTVNVVFQNVNETDEVYVWTFCGVPNRPSFTLTRGATEVKLDSSCDVGGTCGDLQKEDVITCSSEFCESGDLIRIEHGATYTFPWLATEQVLETMPASCYDASKQDLSGSQCWQKIPLQDGTMIAGGEYFGKLDVEQGAGCPCMVSLAQPGVCVVNKTTCDVYTGNPALPGVEFDPASSNEIVFQIY